MYKIIILNCNYPIQDNKYYRKDVVGIAVLKEAKTEEEIKKLTPTSVKKAYNSLAETYNKIINGELIRCCKCGEHLSASVFYTDSNYANHLFPICKKCILAAVEQRTKKSDTPNETKESVQYVLRKMDLPYIDELYMSCVKKVNDQTSETNRKSPFTAYITCLKSLPQYYGLTWENSEFGVDSSNNYDITLPKKTKVEAIKRFGLGYSDEDYKFLSDEYKDWCDRYECQGKSMEILFQRIVD